jgi:hypothetical protein
MHEDPDAESIKYLLAVAQTRLRVASYFFISLQFPVLPSLPSIYRTLYRALSDTSLYMHLYTYVGVRVAPVTTHCL